MSSVNGISCLFKTFYLPLHWISEFFICFVGFPQFSVILRRFIALIRHFTKKVEIFIFKGTHTQGMRVVTQEN